MSYPNQPGTPTTAGSPATLGPRFLARLLDGLILAAVSIIIGLVLGGGLVASGTAGEGGAAAGANALGTLLSVVIAFAYFGLLDSSQGATLGKKALGLRVSSPRGDNPTFVESAKRNVFYAFGLLGLVPFLGIIGSLASLAAVIVIAVQISQDGERRQAWHDAFAGGTQVLKTR